MKKKKIKKSLIIALVLAFLLILAGTAIAVAQVLENQNSEKRVVVRTWDPAPEFSWSGRGEQRLPLGADIDYDSFLADALGISVEELQEARSEAYVAAIQYAADEGYLAQRRVDQLLGVHAMRGLVNEGELVAKALGVTLEEFQEARQNQALRRLFEELELAPEEVKRAILEQFETIVDEALDDGQITEEQAELLKEYPGLMLRRPIEQWRRGALRTPMGPRLR